MRVSGSASFHVRCKVISDQLLSDGRQIEVADMLGQIEERLLRTRVADPIVAADRVVGYVESCAVHL